MERVNAMSLHCEIWITWLPSAAKLSRYGGVFRANGIGRHI